MKTQANTQELSDAGVVQLDPQLTDQVGGGKYILFAVNGNTYFRDSWSGRIGVEDSGSGTSHWL